MPSFTPSALQAVSRLASFSLAINNVRVVLVTRTIPPDTVHDNVITVAPGDTVVDLNLTIDGIQPGDHLAGRVEFRDGNTVLFEGIIDDLPVGAAGSPPTSPDVPIEFVGPGASAVALSIAPRDTTIGANGSVQFRFAATDDLGDTVTTAEAAWEVVGGASGVTIDNNGLLDAGGASGTVMVIAHTLGGLRDSTNVTISNQPSKLALTTPPSSNAENRHSFDVQPVVQLEDVANNPISVAGVTVTASITSGGGTLLGTTSVQTDANGTATFTNLSIRGTVGARVLTFASGSLSSVTANVTVAAGDATDIAEYAGNGETAIAGSSPAVLPAVLVTDADGNPVQGTSVTFAVTQGGGSGTSPNQTTDAQGVATVGDWTLGTAPGVNKMKATSSGLAGSPVTFTDTATAGAAANIALQNGDGQTATAGSAVSIAPKVLVTDANGNPVSGVAVTFAVASGGGSISGANQTTDAQGKAAVGGWTLGTTAGSNTLTASASGLSGSPVTFTATGVAGAAHTMALVTGDGQSATVGTGVSVSPEVVITDVNGNPVSAVAVSFAVASGGGSVVGASVTSDAQGNAVTGTWTLGTTAGTNTLTASVNGLVGSPVTFTATGTADAAHGLAMVAGDNQSVTVGTAVPTPPKVAVTDQYGNAVSGVSVTFAVASGGGSVTGATQSTDASGYASVGSWTLGTTAGTNTLTASSSGLGGSPLTFTATGVPANANNITLDSGDGQTADAGTAVATLPTVLVTDGNGNAVSGVSITFAVQSGGGSITGASQTTDAQGKASVGSWTLGATAGSNTLTATSTGLSGSPVTFTATGVPGSAATIAVDGGNNQTATVGTNVPGMVSVVVTDAHGNGVSGVTVDIAVESGGGSAGALNQVTDANGIAVLGNWTLGTVAGTNTLSATVSGLSGSPVIFTATGIPDAAAHVAVNAGDGQSATAGHNVPVDPSVVVTDQYGNVVAGVGVTFAVTSGGGSATGTSRTTNASGIATVGSWTLGGTAGSNTLSATATGVATPATFSATGTVGVAANISLYGGDGQSATVNTSVATIPSVLVTDANANPVSGVTVNFTIQSGNGSVSGGSTVTDGTGVASPTDWQLGTIAGANTLKAKATGVTGSVLFTANGTPDAATTIAMNAGDGQSAVYGTAVAIPPSAIVTDQYGNGVSGVSVQFDINDLAATPRPGGALPVGGPATVDGGNSSTISTDAQGIAQVGSWNLGSSLGTHHLQVTAAGLSGTGFNFQATATPGPVANVYVYNGTGQTATVGTAVSIAPAVRVTDAAGNSVAGVTVAFTVASGNGSISNPKNPVTDANGVATIGGWTLGTHIGTKTLTATANSLTATFTATATADVASKFVLNASPAATVTNREVFATQPRVQLADQYGNPVKSSGIPVDVSINNSGIVAPTGSVSTNSNGVAVFSGMYIAGTVGTTYTLNFDDSDHVLGAATVDITITQAGPVSSVSVFSGDGQLVLAGGVVPVAPVFIATDPESNPIGGLQLTVSASGGGTLSDGPETLITGSDGKATVTGTWTLGPDGGDSDALHAYAPVCPGDCYTPNGTAFAAGVWQVSAVSAGASHACAIEPVNSYAVCWGSNDQYQLSQGPSSTLSGGTSGSVYARPQQATAVAISLLASGGQHSCAVDPNQAAFSYYEACTGDDEYGQLGDDDSYSPYADHFSDTFLNESVLPTQIAAGDWHGCTLEGTVIECFGRNLEGQLGDSSTYDHQGYPQSILLDNASWIYVTAGGNSTCAIDSNNDAYCWGDNGYGQLGTGDSTYRSGPTLVGGSHKWSQIVISGGHACGITTGGATLCWGDDTYGQLGDGLGASAGVDLPQAVSGGQTFTKISVGLSLSCGIEAVTGHLYCWGLNSDGQVGDGKGGFYPYDQIAWSPSQEANSYSWTDVSVSSTGQFVCGIESSLSGLFCWGYNGSGQLGHGDQTSYNTPRAAQTYVSAPAAGRRPPVASLQLPAAHTPAIGPAARQTPGVRLRQPSAARRTQRQ